MPAGDEPREPAPPRAGGALGRVLVPLGAAACLLPFVSTAEALALGLVLALVAGNPWAAITRKATKWSLTAAVIGLGAGMDLGVVLRAGKGGIAYTVAGIALSLGLGFLLTRALRVPGKIGALISVGTAICGGSAIAAMVPILKPKEHEVSVALGTVFLLNAVALFAFPPIGHAVGLDDAQFGLWSAVAIHDTSSVVGAAVSWGGGAPAVATTVKLARALWIVPVALAAGAVVRKRGGTADKPKPPWFIAGFLAAAALVTFVPALAPAGHLVAHAASRLLVVTLFLIGAGLTREALRSVGVRPLAHGLILWLVNAGVSLAAITALAAK